MRSGGLGPGDERATVDALDEALGPDGAPDDAVSAFVHLLPAFSGSEIAEVAERADVLWDLAQLDATPNWIETAAAVRLIARTLAAPDGVAEARETVEWLLATSTWPTGTCFLTLAMVAEAAHRGDVRTAHDMADEVHELSRLCGAPFFAQTCDLLLGGLAGPPEVAQRLAAANENLDRVSGESATDHLSAAIKEAVAALVAAEEDVVAARLVGYVTTLEPTNPFTDRLLPGYREALAVLTDRLSAPQLARLRADGRNLVVADARALVSAAADRHRGRPV